MGSGSPLICALYCLQLGATRGCPGRARARALVWGAWQPATHCRYERVWALAGPRRFSRYFRCLHLFELISSLSNALPRERQIFTSIN
jgi:hypothetical protein